MLLKKDESSPAGAEDLSYGSEVFSASLHMGGRLSKQSLRRSEHDTTPLEN